jgi:hypothetical protein
MKFSRYHCRHHASDLASIEKLAAELHVKSYFTFFQSPIVLLQLQHFHQVGVLRSFLKHCLCQLLIGYFSYPSLYAVTIDLPHCGFTKLSLKVKLEPKENTSDPIYSSVTKHEYALSNEEICLSTTECTCALCLKSS